MDFGRSVLVSAPPAQVFILDLNVRLGEAIISHKIANNVMCLDHLIDLACAMKHRSLIRANTNGILIEA